MLDFLKKLFNPRPVSPQMSVGVPAVDPNTYEEVQVPLAYDRASNFAALIRATDVVKKPARKVTKVFIHCSASDNPKHDNIATITKWHLARGFKTVGYHFFVTKEGRIQQGRDIEEIPAAQKGHNTSSIAICFHGLAANKFTPAQMQVLVDFCVAYHQMYDGKLTFHGHREVEPGKTCPVFDYKSTLQLDDKGRMKTRTVIRVKE